MNARRITVFDSLGILEKILLLERGTVEIGRGQQLSMQARALLSGWRLESAPAGGLPSLDFAYEYPRLIFDTTGAVVDTLGYGKVEANVGDGPGVRVSPTSQHRITLSLLSEQPLHGFLSDGSYDVSRTLPHSAHEAAFTVTRLDKNGDTVFHHSLVYKPVPIDREFGESMTESLVASVASQYRDWARQDVKENVRLPKFRPPVTFVWAAPDDGLWLRTTAEFEIVARWFMLDATGHPVGRIELPSVARLRWAKGNMLWVELRDDLNVPWIVRYRLSPN